MACLLRKSNRFQPTAHVHVYSVPVSLTLKHNMLLMRPRHALKHRLMLQAAVEYFAHQICEDEMTLASNWNLGQVQHPPGLLNHGGKLKLFSSFVV